MNGNPFSNTSARHFDKLSAGSETVEGLREGFSKVMAAEF